MIGDLDKIRIRHRHNTDLTPSETNSLGVACTKETLTVYISMETDLPKLHHKTENSEKSRSNVMFWAYNRELPRSISGRDTEYGYLQSVSPNTGLVPHIWQRHNLLP